MLIFKRSNLSAIALRLLEQQPEVVAVNNA